jgi:hypothetical protein
MAVYYIYRCISISLLVSTVGLWHRRIGLGWAGLVWAGRGWAFVVGLCSTGFHLGQPPIQFRHGSTSASPPPPDAPDHFPADSRCRVAPPLPRRLNNNIFSMLRIASRAVRPVIRFQLCKYSLQIRIFFGARSTPQLFAQFLQVLHFILYRSRLGVGDPTAP